MIQNLCIGWIDRIKKVYEFKRRKTGTRIFQKKENKYKWEKPDELPNQRVVYNDKNLKINKQKK